MVLRDIARLLEDHPKEAAKWIKIHGRAKRGKFAVIKISGASLDEHIDDIADALSTLYRLQLYPTIVYGWGNTLTERLLKAGIVTEKHANGDRITTRKAMPYVQEISKENGLKVRTALKRRDVRSTLCKNVFEAEPKFLFGVDYKHYTGKIINTNLSEIDKAVAQRKMRIVSPLGTHYQNIPFLPFLPQWKTQLNVNADTSAKELVNAVRPTKYIALTNTGGILNKQGQIIPTISISKQYDELIRSGTVYGDMKKKLDEARDVIRLTEGNVVVEVVHPKNLLSELFTDIGKGTYITR